MTADIKIYNPDSLGTPLGNPVNHFFFVVNDLPSPDGMLVLTVASILHLIVLIFIGGR